MLNKKIRYYDFSEIEKKWQLRWYSSEVFTLNISQKNKKYWGLIEFPYPSMGGMHIGNPRCYVAMDVICRWKRLEDYNVWFPIGWDSFSAITEKKAAEKNIDPFVLTKKSIIDFRKQLQELGLSCDFKNEINTIDSDYIIGTQKVFNMALNSNALIKTDQQYFVDVCYKKDDILRKIEKIDIPFAEKTFIKYYLNDGNYNTKVQIFINNKNICEINARKLILYPGKKLKLYINVELCKRILKNVLYKESFDSMFEDLEEYQNIDFQTIVDCFAINTNISARIPIILADMDDEAVLLDDERFLCKNKYIPVFENRRFGEPIPQLCLDDDKGNAMVLAKWWASSWYYYGYFQKYFENNPSIIESNQNLTFDIYCGYESGYKSALHIYLSLFVNELINEHTEYKNIFFQRRICHGEVLSEEGERLIGINHRKISYKSVIDEVGADAYRLYILSFGEFSKTAKWNNTFLEYVIDDLNCLWDAQFDIENEPDSKLNCYFQRIEKLYNNDDLYAVCNILMEILEFIKCKKIRMNKEDYHKLIRYLYPVVPHICEEINERLGFMPLYLMYEK